MLSPIEFFSNLLVNHTPSSKVPETFLKSFVNHTPSSKPKPKNPKIVTHCARIVYQLRKWHKRLSDCHIGRKYVFSCSWIKKFATMAYGLFKLASPNIYTWQTTRMKLIWIDYMIVIYSKTSPYRDELSIRYQPSKIEIRINITTVS